MNYMLEECSLNTTLLYESLLFSSCCVREKTDWLVQDKEDQFKCELRKCQGDGGFYFQGRCYEDLYEDGLCATGERLFISRYGEAYCDCDEGWVRYDGKCYQEFTPAFCAVENQILKLGQSPDSCKQLFFSDQIQ